MENRGFLRGTDSICKLIFVHIFTFSCKNMRTCVHEDKRHLHTQVHIQDGHFHFCQKVCGPRQSTLPNLGGTSIHPRCAIHLMAGCSELVQACDWYPACIAKFVFNKLDGPLKVPLDAQGSSKTVLCSSKDISSCWQQTAEPNQHPVAWSAALGGCLDRHVSNTDECGAYVHLV